jgi:hypothetical protein
MNDSGSLILGVLRDVATSAAVMAAQAQKHVTHNEALRLLDAMVQLAVLDRPCTAPPPAAPKATGIWWPRARPGSGRAGI